MPYHVVIAILVLSLPAAVAAQDSSLFRSGAPEYQRRPLSMEEANLLYQQPEPIPQVQLHDIVTVVVNINSRTLSEGDAESRKLSSLNAVLSDWILLDGLRKVTPDPQSAGDPAITGQVNKQFRAQSDLETRNTLNFTIAAKVVDVRPNGNLLVEARDVVRINEEVWERSLSGIIRRQDVSPDNKILSEDIVDLEIHMAERGQVRDGYRRGWIQRAFDHFMPF